MSISLGSEHEYAEGEAGELQLRVDNSFAFWTYFRNIAIETYNIYDHTFQGDRRSNRNHLPKFPSPLAALLIRQHVVDKEDHILPPR